MSEFDSVLPYTHSEIFTQEQFKKAQEIGLAYGVEVTGIPEGEPYTHIDPINSQQYHRIVPSGHVYVALTTFKQDLSDFWKQLPEN